MQQAHLVDHVPPTLLRLALQLVRLDLEGGEASEGGMRQVKGGEASEVGMRQVKWGGK